MIHAYKSLHRLCLMFLPRTSVNWKGKIVRFLQNLVWTAHLESKQQTHLTQLSFIIGPLHRAFIIEKVHYLCHGDGGHERQVPIHYGCILHHDGHLYQHGRSSSVVAKCPHIQGHRMLQCDSHHHYIDQNNSPSSKWATYAVQILYPHTTSWTQYYTGPHCLNLAIPETVSRNS